MSTESEERSSLECGSELLKRQFLFDPGYRNLNHGKDHAPLLKHQCFDLRKQTASTDHHRQFHSHLVQDAEPSVKSDSHVTVVC